MLFPSITQVCFKMELYYICSFVIYIRWVCYSKITKITLHVIYWKFPRVCSSWNYWRQVREPIRGIIWHTPRATRPPAGFLVAAHSWRASPHPPIPPPPKQCLSSSLTYPRMNEFATRGARWWPLCWSARFLVLASPLFREPLLFGAWARTHVPARFRAPFITRRSDIMYQ